MGEVVSLDQFRDAARLKTIRENLPEGGGLRWVVRRKAAVVAAIDCGAITRAEAKARYALSDEELDSWRAAVADMGASGQARRLLQHYRNSRSG